MIKVDLTKKNKIIIKGHAGYAEKGYDIVCASVSSIAITTINALIELNPKSISYKEEESKITIDIFENDDITNELIKNMILLFENLENDYKNNIKIIRR